MTREQLNQIQMRIFRSDNAHVPDLRAECERLMEERAQLLEGARFLFEHNPQPLLPRWAGGLSKAVEQADAEWKLNDQVQPLTPAR